MKTQSEKTSIIDPPKEEAISTDSRRAATAWLKRDRRRNAMKYLAMNDEGYLLRTNRPVLKEVAEAMA